MRSTTLDIALKGAKGTVMELEAVIFDLDGVLADTTEHHYQAWKQVAEKLGIPFSQEDNERLRGLSRRSCLEMLLAGRAIPEDELYELLEMKNDLFLELIKEMGPQDLMPGAAALFHELGAAGIPIGIASSSGNAHLVIEKLQLGGFIAAIGDRFNAARLKPEPDIFLFAASALGHAPEACIAIEDSLAGIEAAHAAGMCVVGVDGAPALRDGNPDAYYSSLTVVTLEILRQVHRSWMERRASSLSASEPGYKLDSKFDLLSE